MTSFAGNQQQASSTIQSDIVSRLSKKLKACTESSSILSDAIKNSEKEVVITPTWLETDTQEPCIALVSTALFKSNADNYQLQVIVDSTLRLNPFSLLIYSPISIVSQYAVRTEISAPKRYSFKVWIHLDHQNVCNKTFYLFLVQPLKSALLLGRCEMHSILKYEKMNESFYSGISFRLSKSTDAHTHFLNIIKHVGFIQKSNFEYVQKSFECTLQLRPGNNEWIYNLLYIETSNYLLLLGVIRESLSLQGVGIVHVTSLNYFETMGIVLGYEKKSWTTANQDEWIMKYHVTYTQKSEELNETKKALEGLFGNQRMIRELIEYIS